METLAQEIRVFIVANFLFGEESGDFSFTDEDSFHDRGVIDSTGILELVCFLEEKYQIAIADQDLVPENLDSIVNVARFVDRKRRDALGLAHAS